MVKIELLSNDAMEMLKNMEKKNLISVKDDDWNNDPYVIKGSGKKYPKGYFAGILKLSPEKRAEWDNYIKESRNEWERSIV